MVFPHRLGARIPGISAAITIFIFLFLCLHLWDLDDWRGAGHYARQKPHHHHHGEHRHHSHPPLPKRIPRKIWYKLGPKGLSNDAKRWTDSCIQNNTAYKPHFFDDDTADAFVARNFAMRPDLVETYRALTVPILKADLFRYLLLYREGGVWSDLDVSCEGPPIDDWVGPRYKPFAGLVVGWEFDVGWGHNFMRQFASWTFMAVPRLPHLWVVVEDILEAIHGATAEHNVTVAGLTLEMVGDVIDFTGPRRFTGSVFKSLAWTIGRTVDRSGLVGLLEPKLVGDVLILPGYSFAASSNTYDEGDLDRVGPALVKHHYAGSWKNVKGGELL
ncbi:hypothetical protein QBC47DRAFT_395767 [Echria macrotheca]|uniref:Mannosyltransferase n=1 Tax=Echria macrotheca TaxID=438768 RepID=A0AAJ0B0N2_9PEZI|nr:hypothetical protein QBC47DRAFT_395767 [Echria macrotheca]